MPKITKFFVQFNSDRNKKIAFTNIDDTLTVKQLKDKIIEIEGSGKGSVSTLVYGSKSMSDDKTLSYYGVKKLRTIFATFKLQGGTSTEEVLVKLKLNVLEKLEVKLSSHECGLMGTFSTCKSSSTQRMKLPICTNTDQNCWYCYKCLQETAQRAAKQFQIKIQCPNKCGCFDFERLLECCHFTENEEADILYKFDKNALEKKGIKDCPGCKNFVSKPREVKGNRVRCPNTDCEWNKKDYCFLCNNPWQSSSNNDKCGRPECEDDFVAMADLQLSQCVTKDYKYTDEVGTIKNIPVIRMCPNPTCNALIEWEYDGKCKHLECPRCDHGYCHSCLKQWYSCKCIYCQETKGPVCTLKTKCTPAPRQNVFTLLGV